MVTYDARPTTFTPLTTQFEWEKLFSVMGIFDGIDGSNDFVPSTPASGSISMAAGTVIIKGQLWRADAAVSTPLPANPAAGMLRTDVLWIQYNRAASTSPTVVQQLITSGAPAASNPTPPPPTQNPVGNGGSGVWQIPVAQWTVNNAGAITNFKDIRQFSGKSTLLMFSTARPTPAQPRLGLEIDTGNLMRWDGVSTWYAVVPVAPPKTQSWHWTFGGSNVGTTAAVIPGSQQPIAVAALSMVIVTATMDIAMPSTSGVDWLGFAQLDGVNIGGNEFAIVQGAAVRITAGRTWVAPNVAAGTHNIGITQSSSTANVVANRGGDVTVLAVPN